MKDITSFIKSLLGFITQTVTTTPVETAVVNTLDFESVAFQVSVGTFTFTAVNTFEIKLQDSDDNVTYADVDSLFVTEANRSEPRTTGTVFLNDTGDDDQVYQLGYTGKKEFVKAVVVGAAATSVAVTAMALLGNPDYVPTPLQYKGVEA